MSALFVTATGTDVGKTFVTCALIRSLRAQGRDVAAIKPVVSGFDHARPDASDTAALLASLGRPLTDATVAAVSPWRFAAPLSPDMAARRENRVVDVPALVEFCRGWMAGPEPLLIEGIGGLMVPLDDRHTVLDWIGALDIPVLLVAGSYLGSLSHTLTAIDALAARRRSITALVVSESPDSTVPLDETVDTLRRFAVGVDVVALPRLAARSEHPAFAKLAALLSSAA